MNEGADEDGGKWAHTLYEAIQTKLTLPLNFSAVGVRAKARA